MSWVVLMVRSLEYKPHQKTSPTCKSKRISFLECPGISILLVAYIYAYFIKTPLVLFSVFICLFFPDKTYYSF